MKQEIEITAHNEAPKPSDYMNDLKAENGFEDITDSQAAEYLETLFNIMQAWANAGFDVAAIPRYLTDITPKTRTADSSLVELTDSAIKSPFTKSAAQNAGGKEES